MFFFFFFFVLFLVCVFCFLFVCFFDSLTSLLYLSYCLNYSIEVEGSGKNTITEHSPSRASKGKANRPRQTVHKPQT